MGDAAEAKVVARAEERLGKVLREKWRLDTLLGIGGMAAVYAATHRNGKRAAIKILQPEAALVPDIKARFLREGYLANKVGHPGALSILDDDVDVDGTVYLVMELLHGETLDERWQRNGHLPWQEVLPVAYQALEVLAAAHGKDIVHRDIKPGNLFIDVESGIKILDFGIARLHNMQLTTGKTGHDTALGTPGFMPPEQARGRSDLVDARSDLWGLGATMFAVLAGRHVHEAETANEQLMLAMTAPPMSLAEALPDVPSEVAAVVDKALKYEKDERYADARAMQAEIADAYEQLLGEPITGAPRLSVLVGKKSRSVHPDAPTVSADTTDRNTTTRPVSESSAIAPVPPQRRRAFWVAALALFIVPLGIWLLTRSASHAEPAQTPASGAPETVAPKSAEAVIQPVVAPTASEPAASPSAERSSSSRTTDRGKSTKHPNEAPSSKPASEKPAQTGTGVDIFERRH